MKLTQKHWQLAALTLISLLGLAFLFQAKDPNTVMARAAMMQGVAAIALLYVTWISINRSDEQIRISNEILSLEYRHHLAVNVDLHGEEIYLVNLSKLSIYLLDIRTEVETLRIVNYSLSDNIVLEPGKQVTVPTEGIYAPTGPEEDLTWNPAYDIQELQKKLDEDWQKRYIVITYLYAGTGQRQYTKLFAIEPEAVPWRSEEPTTWVARLVPMKDYGVPFEEETASERVL